MSAETPLQGLGVQRILRLKALWAGASAAVLTLALVVSLGLLAYAPLGDQGARAGLAAALIATLVSAAVFACTARAGLPTAGPSSPTALILAGLIDKVMLTQAAAADAATQSLAVVAACSAAVVGMGVLQMAMATLRLGRWVGFVPQPAIAGFMNGVALLVLLAQVPALLAIDPASWKAAPWHALLTGHWGALALGLSTAAGVLWLARRAPRWPGGLLVLLLGSGKRRGRVSNVNPVPPMAPRSSNITHRFSPRFLGAPT